MARHQHQWEPVATDYQAPPEFLTSVQGASADVLREAMFGVTIVTQRCTGCGWTDFSRTAGKVGE
jgi:hypothetical protein